MSTQVLPALTRLTDGAVAVTKVDTEKYPDLATRFRIEGLPTLVLFVDGLEAARLEGLLPATEVASWVKKELKLG